MDASPVHGGQCFTHRTPPCRGKFIQTGAMVNTRETASVPARDAGTIGKTSRTTEINLRPRGSTSVSYRKNPKRSMHVAHGRKTPARGETLCPPSRRHSVPLSLPYDHHHHHRHCQLAEGRTSQTVEHCEVYVAPSQQSRIHPAGILLFMNRNEKNKKNKIV